MKYYFYFLIIITLCSCYIIGDNPINTIEDFNPKEGRVGDIITISVDLHIKQEFIDELTAKGGDGIIQFRYSHDPQHPYIDVVEYISATATEIVCKVPEGAITGVISVRDGLAGLAGNPSEEKFTVIKE